MKNIVLIGSVTAIFLVFISRNVVDLNICNNLDYVCRTIWDTIENISYFFILLFIFSLLTFFMHSRVFNSWWKFARIAIPVILFISTLINLKLHHSPSGGVLNMDDMFDLPILFLMYVVFVVGSLVQIYKGYRNK